MMIVQKKLIALIFLITLLGCRPIAPEKSTEPTGGMGMGMGMGGGMMERHHASIPEEYAGLSNPIPAEDVSWQRGGETYATHCASCHGDGGMGDGPAGAALDPAPAAVAHTSQMMGDDYLFWRISEGGAGFTTSMPAWKEILSEEARWDVINYLRALGSGDVQPRTALGGESFDPQALAAQQAEMLAQAVDQKIISQQEADIFTEVHTVVENYRISHPELINQESDATKREAAILAALVGEGTISQEQAESFKAVHDKLGASGLMP